MSIAILVKVSEGVVLGADSAATVQGQLEGPRGTQQILKTYYNARKLLQIGDLPIGVLTWGIGQIGMRTIESLVREWEHEKHWQSREDYCSCHDSEKAIRVQRCAEDLRVHLHHIYQETQDLRDIPPEKKPPLGVAVAGYSDSEFFPEIWQFTVPFSDQVVNQRPDLGGKPDFGANWYGLTDAIVRLHWGRDERVIAVLAEKTGIAEQEIRELLAPLQYQIPFAVMPLQDAIEYARYMLSVTIGRYRFAMGPELCGGQIEIAAISQGSFDWISRKEWKSGG